MPLTGLHTDWQYGSYESDRNEHVKQKENTTKPLTKPYYDHSIGIGYGYDLRERVHAEVVRDPVTRRVVIDPVTNRPQYTGTAPEIISDLNAVNNFLGLQGAQRVTITQADINLLAEAKLNKGRRQAIAEQELALRFPSDRFAENLLYLLVGRYEPLVNNILGGALQLPESKERIAVISLAYHMTNATQAGISKALGRALSAIRNDNRAEAWYVMRYAANPDNNRDRAIRCYAEAEYFGLSDEGAFTVAEAKEVMRMYTSHELEAPQAEKMTTYEGRFPTTIARDPLIVDIDAEVAGFRNYLIDNFTPLSWFPQGETINGRVMVGRGLPTYAYLDNGNYADNMTGTDQNDLIFGEEGNDTLRDGAGNDVVYGGQGDDHFYSDSGNDFPYGGENNDYYFVNSDPGGANRTVRIEDKDGTDNRVMINGRLVVRFNKAADGSLGYEYSSADRRFTGRRDGIDFVVTENGSTIQVILNEDFQQGEFGIRFYDELTPPVNPVTNNVIQGDQDPQNLNDSLRDTTGNDKILCGAGDDSVFALWGGADWIKGEDGRDILDGESSTNCVIEGGAGSDVLFGSYVTGSQIFGDSYGEKQALVDAGETAQGTNQKGDLIAGGYPGGDNFLYGSNGKAPLMSSVAG